MTSCALKSTSDSPPTEKEEILIENSYRLLAAISENEKGGVNRYLKAYSPGWQNWEKGPHFWRSPTLQQELDETFSNGIELDLEIILKLAQYEHPLFDLILQYPVKISTNDLYDCNHEYQFNLLCRIKSEYLRLMIEKFDDVLTDLTALTYSDECRLGEHFRIENLDLMLGTDFEDEVIDIITGLNSWEVLNDLMHRQYNEKHITESFCFLLSYGLKITDDNLEVVYSRFGFCDLFKIMLHMDIKICNGLELCSSVVPHLIYNPNLYLEDILPYLDPSFSTDILDLFCYFVHEKLIKFRKELVEIKILADGEDYSRIPSLVELSRNGFREYFIDEYQIQTSRDFFTLLNRLPVNNVCKKIISYETKLYKRPCRYLE